MKRLTKKEADQGSSRWLQQKAKTTPFIEQLKIDYLEAQLQEEEERGTDEAAKTDEVASLVVERDPKHEKAVALYGEYHKRNLEELKDYLRWIRQVLKGTKAFILHTVFDGNLNGTLS